MRCGHTPVHPRSECPATNHICRKCHKTGHFDHCCRMKNVSSLTAEEDYAFLGVTERGDTTYSPWYATVGFQGQSIKFKIDTGADITAVPESLYNEKTWKTPMKTTKIQARTAGGSCLQVLGVVTGSMQRDSLTSQQDVYIVRGLHTSLLGRPPITALQLLRRLDTVNADSGINIQQEFSSLFNSLGKIPGEYQIQVQDNVKPFALSTPRRVPYHYWEK